MNHQKKLEQTAPPNKHMYTGNLGQQQVYGTSYKGKRYSSYESFSNHQNLLYNRAVFGLAMYQPEEVKAMHFKKRKQIIAKHKKAQIAINILKQQVINRLSNDLLLSLFPNSPITKKLLELDFTDVRYINKMPFKTLRITKRQIIDKLVAENILPANFYNLKTTV